MEEEVNGQKGEEILPESPGYYSRIFLVPKQEWKNEAHNRFFHSEQICSNTRLQNTDSEKKMDEEVNRQKREEILTRHVYSVPVRLPVRFAMTS